MTEIVIIFIYDKLYKNNSSVCCMLYLYVPCICMFFNYTPLLQKHIDKNYSCLISGCGGIVSGTSGVITSPNFPNDYNHDDHCAWRIDAPVGETITVSWSLQQQIIINGTF